MSHENHFPYEPTDAASAVEDAETAGPSTMEAPGEAEAAPPGPTTNDEHTDLSDPSPPATTAAPEQAPHLRTTILPLPAVTTFTGSRNVVVGSVENLNQTIRMREWLDGVPVDRHQLVTADPFVRGESWNAAWKEACAGFADQNTRVLIVVSPRGIGSTTFALQFLARETSDANQLFKLETGWKSPTIGALPGETRRAYQLDLKDPERDRADSAFLQGLSSYADTLASLDSHIVFTIADDLWLGNRLKDVAGIHVVYLNDPPSAQDVVEAHLSPKHPDLVPYVQQTTARKQLIGLNAVEAVRAAGTVVGQAVGHRLRRSAGAARAPLENGLDPDLKKLIDNALSDWREELDIIFDEIDSIPETKNDPRPLPLDDRCLLLAVLVSRDVPAPEAAEDAKTLLDAISPVGQAGAADTGAGFAGRGLRRRFKNIGATVDSHDRVTFDRVGFAEAVLAYVWDNYALMRPVLLRWLVVLAGRKKDGGRVVSALSDLVLRHGDMSSVTDLRPIALRETNGVDILAQVLLRAVRDEHVGPLAWSMLYTWADSSDVHGVVVSVCRNVLRDAAASVPSRRMAVVRLRRVVQAAAPDSEVLRETDGFLRELAQMDDGLERLMDMIEPWLKSGYTPTAGKHALIALMPEMRGGIPWLLSDNPPPFDVERALGEVLADEKVLPEAIPHLSRWLHACSADTVKYEFIRDRILLPLKEHSAFTAGLKLMESVGDLRREDGTTVSTDILKHFGDPRVLALFAPQG